MVRIIFGVLFILSGFSAIQSSGVTTFLVGVAIGAYLIWSGYNARKNKQMEAEEAVRIEAEAVRTYSFKPVGTRFACKIQGRFKERQAILNASQVGETCYLQEYEWEGRPAVMVVSEHFRQDLGVVPEGKVGEVLKLMEVYDTRVRITQKDEFEMNGRLYTGFDAQILCMPR